MNQLYLLDAVNLLFRSYYAIGPITNPQGESTNALYGFIRSVLKIIKECAPEGLVAVFDGPDSGQTRKALYGEYKSHRKGMPDDLYPQLEWALKFCELYGLPFLSVPNVEADDVMGSIARWASQKKITTYLCTSDKDLCQLVSDHVFVLNLHKEMLKVGRDKVKELYGVYPEQMVDLLSLMGDASDNIPGIEGIGPKTAIALLEEFGSLDALFARTGEISGKKKERVEHGKEMALLSRKLATIDQNLEVPQDLAFYKVKSPDLEHLREFYQRMHFLSLLKELPVKEHQTGPLAQEPQYLLVNDLSTLKDLVENLLIKEELCVDTETTGLDPMRADLIGVGLGSAEGQAWYIPFNGSIDPEKAKETLRPLFLRKRFFGHNIKYDLHVLKRAGLAVSHVSFDTMLASYLLAPHKQRHGLDPLALEFFGKVKIPITDLIGKGKSQISMAEVPLEQAATYCCEDVDYTIRLKNLFQQRIKQEKLERVLQEIELPLLPILFEMEERGIFLDVEKMALLKEDLSLQIEQLSEQIYQLAGVAFNLNSPKQLGEILFEKLSIAPAKKTATGSFSTSADTLEELQESSPIIPLILKYRTLEKLRSTYVDVLPAQVNPETKRIHCTFNQSVTATGRLSCQDPNLQNIPVRSAEGLKIRSAFRPKLPLYSFLAADYSQIELRLLAHFSEDPQLLQAFANGQDIHAHTASLVFDLPLQEIRPEMRHAAKAVNFGIIYGQQAFGLSKELGISVEEAKTFIQTYFKRYPRVKDYLEACRENTRKTGMAITLMGRKRPIPEILNKNPLLRQGAERLAVNTPLQGTAADLIKLAMIALSAEKLQMILQIHDELIFEIPDGELEEAASFVKEKMEKVWRLKVPLIVDISIGKNWGEC